MYGSPKNAFDATDAAPKDGRISPEEFENGCRLLAPQVRPRDAALLFSELDKDGSGSIEPEEFYEKLGGCSTCADKFGVPLPEFQERLQKKHGTPKEVFDALDHCPKDGNISLEEFQAGCKDLHPPISPEEARLLFDQMDKAPKDGTLSPEELYGALGEAEKFGLSVAEFKKRVKEEVRHATCCIS